MPHAVPSTTLALTWILRGILRWMSVCVLPAERPAGTRTAADVDAAGPYGVARCSPAASGGAEPHGWCLKHGEPPWSNWQMPSANQRCRGSKGAEVCPITLFRLGSPGRGQDTDEKIIAQTYYIKWSCIVICNVTLNSTERFTINIIS